MINMNFHKLTPVLSTTLLCLTVLAMFSFKTLAQTRNQAEGDPLASIPTHQRARFTERLKLLVEYQSMRQWDKMYDLVTSSIKGGRSKETFADRRQDLEIKPPISTLLTFVPTEAIIVDESQGSGAWLVLGCAQYRRGGKVVQIKSSVKAELQNNEWFFSEIGSAIQIDGKEESCCTPRTVATAK